MQKSQKFLFGTLAIAVGFCIWLTAYLLIAAIFHWRDKLRGDAHGLQFWFVDEFSSGLAGYAATKAARAIFKHVGRQPIFWGISTPIFLFMIGLPGYFILHGSSQLTFSWNDQLSRWLAGALAIVGVYIGCHRQFDE